MTRRKDAPTAFRTDTGEKRTNQEVLLVIPLRQDVIGRRRFGTRICLSCLLLTYRPAQIIEKVATWAHSSSTQCIHCQFGGELFKQIRCSQVSPLDTSTQGAFDACSKVRS